MIDDNQGLTMRPPAPEDGARVFRLVAQCPPLDANSVYCNLLQCSHFASTSVAAEKHSELVGFISGYIPPGQSDTLFIWQVAVSKAARGVGLATRMISEILQRPACAGVEWLETTITPDNNASWRLFEGFAAKQGAQLSKRVMFEEQKHFLGDHQTEFLVRIGPLKQRP